MRFDNGQYESGSWYSISASQVLVTQMPFFMTLEAQITYQSISNLIFVLPFVTLTAWWCHPSNFQQLAVWLSRWPILKLELSARRYNISTVAVILPDRSSTYFILSIYIVSLCREPCCNDLLRPSAWITTQALVGPTLSSPPCPFCPFPLLPESGVPVDPKKHFGLSTLRNLSFTVFPKQ